jgi:hypothetical protein
MILSMTSEITYRALTQRINRALAKKNQKLCASRSAATKAAWGEYHLISLSADMVCALRVNPEELGHKLGVIHPGEKVA